MISIIKTAIITIIISFISGLLLEYYKNVAPKILCNIGKGIPIERNNKKFYAYIVNVKNISNKIIHDITVNIQSPQNNLKIRNAKITKGLKFESSIKDNILDVDIPFLSKDDEFSVELYVENEYGVHNRPVIIIRSPENFKEVHSVGQKGILNLLFNMPKNTIKTVSKAAEKNGTTVFNHRNKKAGKSRKAMIIAALIILVMSVGLLGGFYFKEMPDNTQTPSVKNDVEKHSTDETESAVGTNKNAGVRASTGGTNKNTGTKTSTEGTNKNTDTKASTGGTNKTPDAKTSTGVTTGSTDTKTSTGGTTGSTDAKTSTDETTKTPDTKTSTDETTKTPDTKTSTEGTTKTADAKVSTGGTTGSTDAKTSTGGTTGNVGD